MEENPFRLFKFFAGLLVFAGLLTFNPIGLIATLAMLTVLWGWFALDAYVKRPKPADEDFGEEIDVGDSILAQRPGSDAAAEVPTSALADVVGEPARRRPTFERL
jgi:hypothetical protein